MEITSDVILKGHDWKQALDVFSPFFPQNLQPNYSIYVISMSIGIMYGRRKRKSCKCTENCFAPA